MNALISPETRAVGRGEAVAALRAVLPDRCILANDEETRAYECDGLAAYRQMPMIVLLPESLAAMETDMVAPLRAWNRARLTARQLDELSDRQLNDIGVVRGDIDELAYEAARKAVVAANANNIEPKAA